MTTHSVTLKRTLGFWALVAYGVGDILGAGIYALTGKIAGIAGSACWVAFAVAMFVGSLTAISYAELSSRFPKSGGEATFCQAAFRRRWVSLLIGWIVLCSGIVSMATVSRAFAGYVSGMFVGLPMPIIIIGFLILLTVINFWGMREASGANIICTAIELTGLCMVLVAGFAILGGSQQQSVVAQTITQTVSWRAILQASAIAFFAFIGFEDMVNVSEEVIDPERTMPRAILTALVFAGTLYILIAWVAVAVVPPVELAASAAPLLEVIHRSPLSIPAVLFTGIAAFAVSNTALLNFVMGSRLIYGMASEGLLPAWLGSLHPTRNTPYLAILVIFGVVVILALSGNLVFLAGTTSLLLLGVFFVVNVALVVIKRRSGDRHSGFSTPIVIPAAGALTSLGLMAFVPPQAITASLIIVILGVLLIVVQAIMQRRAVSR